MRPAALAAVLLLCGCRRRDEARPAPETKPSAPAPAEYSVELMSCRDGEFGGPKAVASAAPSEEPPSDGGLFAPIGDGSVGLGTIGALGFGTGVGFGGTRVKYPIVGAPIEAGGGSALAIARGACSAHRAIRKCHFDARYPVGSVTFDLSVAAGKATAVKTASAIEDEPFVTCLSAALAAAPYATDGKLAYRLTFEPGKLPVTDGVSAGSLTASGRLPPEVIQRILRTRSKDVRACYSAALKTDPKLGGDLKVSFTIDEAGKTKDVKVVSGSIADPTMRACVVKALESVSFPRPDGGVVTVTYPFVFSAG